MNEEYYAIGNDVFVRYSAIASIAAVAAFEVDGTYTLHGRFTDDLLDKLSIKALKKSIEVAINENELIITVNTKIKYGLKIESVSKKVQESVVEAIQMAIGIQPKHVNINVVGIETE